jgi:hypothetical protein
MPYHEVEKPRVRGWFTVTDRSLESCTTPDALAMLAHENGVCLLRQHLARFAKPGGAQVQPGFEHAVRRLVSAPDLWTDTVDAIIQRLRLIQGVVLAYRDSDLWVVNLNDTPVERVQLVMGERPRPQPQGPGVDLQYHDGIAVLERLPAGSVTYLDCSAPLFIADRNAVELDQDLRGVWNFGHGVCRLNFGHSSWNLADRTIPSSRYDVAFDPGLEHVRPWSRASEAELTRLFLGHAALFVRRIAREGEAIDLTRRTGRGRDPTEGRAWRTASR